MNIFCGAVTLSGILVMYVIGLHKLSMVYKGCSHNLGNLLFGSGGSIKLLWTG